MRRGYVDSYHLLLTFEAAPAARRAQHFMTEGVRLWRCRRAASPPGRSLMHAVATRHSHRSGSCHFGLNAHISRRGHHDGAVRGCDSLESLTTFEKILERNDFAR